MPPSPGRRARSAGVALPPTLTSWHGVFGPGQRREREILEETTRQTQTHRQKDNGKKNTDSH